MSSPLLLPFNPLAAVAGAVLGGWVSPGLEVGVVRWCAGGGVLVAPVSLVLLASLGGGVMLASVAVFSRGGFVMVSAVRGSGVMLASTGGSVDPLGAVCVPPVVDCGGASGIVSVGLAGGVGSVPPGCVPLPLPLSMAALLLHFPLASINALYLPLLIPAFFPGPFGTPAGASTGVMAGSVNGLRLNSLGYASKQVTIP